MTNTATAYTRRTTQLATSRNFEKPELSRTIIQEFRPAQVLNYSRSNVLRGLFNEISSRLDGEPMQIVLVDKQGNESVLQKDDKEQFFLGKLKINYIPADKNFDTYTSRLEFLYDGQPIKDSNGKKLVLDLSDQDFPQIIFREFPLIDDSTKATLEKTNQQIASISPKSFTENVGQNEWSKFFRTIKQQAQGHDLAIYVQDSADSEAEPIEYNQNRIFSTSSLSLNYLTRQESGSEKAQLKINYNGNFLKRANGQDLILEAGGKEFPQILFVLRPQNKQTQREQRSNPSIRNLHVSPAAKNLDTGTIIKDTSTKEEINRALKKGAYYIVTRIDVDGTSTINTLVTNNFRFSKATKTKDTAQWRIHDAPRSYIAIDDPKVAYAFKEIVKSK